MPFTESRGSATGPLAPDRRSTKEFEAANRMYSLGPRGSAPEIGTAPASPLGRENSIWVARQNQWRAAFQQRFAHNLRKYWALWRNFDDAPAAGAGQEWRDRTRIPEDFKIISTRVPRKVLGLWGVPEPWTVAGRGFTDTDYEEMVRVLIQESLDDIGNGDPEGETFLKKQIDGTTYSEIIGHTWWKAFWRTQYAFLKTKVPDPSKPGAWRDVEVMQKVYDNVDVCWLPLTHVAIDVYGKPRRWAIERIKTSVEALVAEDERFRRMNGGKPLYPGLPELKARQYAKGLTPRSGVEEPRDTEHWPMDHDGMSHDPAETPCELWLCYDNVQRTLTKIADMSVRLDHGLCPTPDGLDPFIGQPAVPVPGQPYGDSMLNWTAPLSALQTKIARARADETLLNMFQQYIYREGFLGNTSWFWRPGGGLPIKMQNQDRPITDNIMLLPRKPLPPEAYTEENYRQTQAESVAGADAVSQGVEATSKSRDVTAAEINQRVLQGASRFQLEVLYAECGYKRPMLQKIFDLLKQNLTTPRRIRILDDFEGKQIDLRDLERPVDIRIGGTLFDATQAEKLQEIDRLVALAAPTSIFAPYLKPQEILTEILRSTKTLRRTSGRFVRSEEEKNAAMASQTQPAPPGSTGPGSPSAAKPGAEAASLPPGASGAGAPGAAGMGNAAGQTAPPPAAAARGAFEEI